MEFPKNSSDICSLETPLNPNWQSFFDDTAEDIADIDIMFNDFFNNELDNMSSHTAPVLIGNQLLTPPPESDYSLEPGKLLEIGANVTVFANNQHKIIVKPKSTTPEINFSLISPYSSNPQSPSQEVIVDDVFLNEPITFNNLCTSGSFSSYSSTNDFSFDLTNAFNVNLHDQSRSQKIPDFNSMKKGRGRPRKAPEVHLKKLSGRVTKTETKTLRNNAASIKYRHKKASEREVGQQMYDKEKKRNETLQRKACKIENDIIAMKLLIQSYV